MTDAYLKVKLGKPIQPPKKNLPRKINSTFGNISQSLKKRFVYRLFWGRTNFYKKILHLIFIVLTTFVLITGFTGGLSKTKTSNVLASETLKPGDIDLLEQGGSVEAVLLAPSTLNFTVTQHKVQDGEIIEDLATQYGVSIETIKASNLDKIDYYDQLLSPGDILLIPEIEGVLIQAKQGDTLDSIMGKLKEGNKVNIIEINGLQGPDYIIDSDRVIFVPEGKIIPPDKPAPVYVPPVGSYYQTPTSVNVGGLNGIAFSNPLGNPGCAGYGWSRGYTGYHPAVDLPKFGGCQVSAVASGTVTFSGWEPYGGGFAVKIDHGNGIMTVYYHHAELYVQAGQQVAQGQSIGYMGCTGFCTGTHLHFELRINNIQIDPAGYVPY